MNLTKTVQVSFGDCDPAGIVFYPNFFRWMDATFHDALRYYGGHGAVCAQLAAVGIGLLDTSATFKSPARDGDALEIAMTLTEWQTKLFKLRYLGHSGERLVFEGTETRGLFVPQETGISLGDASPLRALMEN